MILADTLIYRVPNKTTVVLQGMFKEVDSLEGVEGFIITTFNKEHKYFFEAGKMQEEMYLHTQNIHCTTHDEYLKGAGAFLKGIEEMKLDKAVFSRVKKIPFYKNAKQLFFRLAELYPDAFVYLVSSPKFGTWIGATPEYLLSTVGNVAKTVALAGTHRKGEGSLWDEKERDEQRYVCEYIREKLRSFNVRNLREDACRECEAGPVNHLVSTFTFSIDRSDIVGIADALHPTPAVSGLPQKEALNLIKNHEQHDRSLYAGVIGYTYPDETDLFVNLRCAQISEDAIYLYLGGGFTKDSDIEMEWEETENKARTLLDVIENL